MSAPRTQKETGSPATWVKICNLCGAPSDLQVFVSLTDDERHRLGAGQVGIRLCASCAGKPNVTKQLDDLLRSILSGGNQSDGPGFDPTKTHGA